MVNNDMHILTLLRKKDRLGQAPDEFSRWFAAQGQAMSNDMNNLLALIPELSDAFGVFKTVITGVSNEFTYLQTGAQQVLKVHEVFNSRVEDLVGNLTFLEQRSKDLNKTFNISSKTAQLFAEDLRDIGIELNYSEESMKKYAGDLKDLTSGFIASTKIKDNVQKNLLALQTYAQANLKVSAEAAAGFENFARIGGTSGMEAAQAIATWTDGLESAGMSGGLSSLQLQADIMETIGGLAENVRVQYSKIPGNLEVAVLKAKALGFTMENLNSAGESLLDIESAVGNELEYQLLSGHRLLTAQGKSLTNEYRLATLKSDGKRQAELMGEFMEKEGKSLQGNIFLRKKAADMFGVDVSVISKALEKQALASKLGVNELMKLDGADLTSKIKSLRAEYKREGADQKIKDLDEFLEKSDTRTTHERVVENNLVEQTIALKKIAGGGLANITRGGKKGSTKEEVAAGSRRVSVAKQRQKAEFAAQNINVMKRSLDSEGAARSIGRRKNAKNVATAVAYPVADLQEATIPFAGPVVGKLTRGVVDNAAPDFNINTTPTGTTTTPVVNGQDVLINPGKGPIIRPAPNDVIAAFRPNDTIHRTLNDMIKPPADNNTHNMSTMLSALEKIFKTQPTQPSQPTLDVKALAAAIATAMQSVKVEAKIRTDDMYSSNRMNNRKNII